jgi:hypothetical protein
MFHSKKHSFQGDDQNLQMPLMWRDELQAGIKRDVNGT